MRSVPALLAIALAASAAQAQSVTLTATLNGAQEVPAVNSPSTGTATLVIHTVTRAWTLDIQFSQLSAPITVAHVHRGPLGVNGPVIIGLDGMALSGGRPSWALTNPGINSFNSGGPLNAPFAWPAAELQNLLTGNTYLNFHTQAFGGGEIRGQLVPGASSAMLLALSGGIAMRRRR